MTAPDTATIGVDLAVVGAGPAGLAAAITAAEHGLRVALVDAGTQPGGQYWRHLDEQTTPVTDRPAAGQHDWRVYLRLRERLDALRAADQITYLPSAQVWFLERAGDAHRLHLEAVVQPPPAGPASPPGSGRRPWCWPPAVTTGSCRCRAGTCPGC